MRALSVSQVLLSVGYGSKRICVAFPDEDFEKKYPPDVCGDEASDHARVWKVYRDQAKEHDEKLLDGWNKTLDILLIFVRIRTTRLMALRRQ